MAQGLAPSECLSVCAMVGWVQRMDGWAAERVAGWAMGGYLGRWMAGWIGG